MAANFGSSRECQLLEALLPLFVDKDLEGFTDEIFKYDQVRETAAFVAISAQQPSGVSPGQLEVRNPADD